MFKLDNLGLALGTNLKFYTNVTEGLKLNVRKFWGLIPTFVEVTWEKLVGGHVCTPAPSLPLIPNKVKTNEPLNVPLKIHLESSEKSFYRYQ